MIALSRNREQFEIHQIGRYVIREPLCAQCRTPMSVVRGEPELQDEGVMWVTYRCLIAGS